MRGTAHAKVNLGLRVRPPRDDGMHPILSVFQSIDWSDAMTLEVADEDFFQVDGADLAADEDNLAWRGIVAMRTGSSPSVRAVLSKEIPVAAGLGGGSADAALGLMMGARLFGADDDAVAAAAPLLGADVPFCLTGGTADVSGIGDEVVARPALSGFALGIVVPPFELATPDVYRRWDEMDGPEGSALDDRHLPPSLRDGFPMANDLEPAARDVEPALGDWMSDLAARWGQPVMMTGSGPSLYGFFPSRDEAADAVAGVSGARAARAVVPIDRGWEIE